MLVEHPTSPSFVQECQRSSSEKMELKRGDSSSSQDSNNTLMNDIEYVWDGEELGLTIQRANVSSHTYSFKWRGNEQELGLTLAMDEASKKIVVKRSTRSNFDIIPGSVLVSYNGKDLSKTDRSSPERLQKIFDKLMAELRTNNLQSKDQTLYFMEPMYPPTVLTPGSKLEDVGIQVGDQLVSINDISVDYLELEAIGKVLKFTSKPCTLKFRDSSEIDEVRYSIRPTVCSVQSTNAGQNRRFKLKSKLRRRKNADYEEKEQSGRIGDSLRTAAAAAFVALVI